MFEKSQQSDSQNSNFRELKRKNLSLKLLLGRALDPWRGKNILFLGKKRYQEIEA
jgi:hypothetical protein